MFLDPRCHDRTDLLARPLKYELSPVDNHPMQHPHHEADASPFTMLAATIVLFVAFVAICTGCSSGSGAPAPSDPSSPPPCYSADEPANDSFLTTEPIAAGAELFMLEGYIHHLDLDCMIVLPATPVAGRLLDVSFDYAFGWDMEVSIGYRTATGDRFSLWGAYDSWGHGVLSQTVELPADAVDLTFSIGQRTLNSPPDSTRYTVTVEVL